MSQEILGWPWKFVIADIFSFKNEYYLCIVHYQRKFQGIKHVEGFSKNNIIKICKIIFFRIQAAQQKYFQMWTQTLHQKSLKTSVSDLAFIMQCQHDITIKMIDRWRHVSNLSKQVWKNVMRLMLKYIWLYCR